MLHYMPLQQVHLSKHIQLLLPIELLPNLETLHQVLFRNLILPKLIALLSDLGKRLSQEYIRAVCSSNALNMQPLIQVVERVLYPVQLDCAVCYGEVVGLFEDVFCVDFQLESDCELVGLVALFEEL